ncbi:hypothetical protein BHU72_06850 [Desulfuribacillus stibiiarsenatis]|uniref:Hemerythrin-like domain-containing protein n=1 Tax=Desulfuribacillus stibiiarsenatis TaxID=1390249 RepID=A0A1E5L465_9FIRM|nr:hemerythrin family protein [Desulfuribacillus stibiiarsenatis]OEH84905.1 hypothetical protein BHU72_06850 [Desulfuribacillus stibiiarsenatis]
MFTWTEELATGNQLIDEQHKEIFRKADVVFHLTTDNVDQEEVIKTFKYLVNYVFEHFNNEEMLMKQHHYEDYEAHKAAHTHFLKQINKFNKDLKENGVTEEFVDDLKLMMVELFVDHIDELDKKMAHAIKG